MKRLLIFTCLLLSASAMSAFPDSFERRANYYPEGGAFVCVNGSNYYSRALYGSNDSEWRIETSDRPIFATYKKGECRNIRFRVNGVALDSADWCKASYVGGRRDYILRDKRWGNGILKVGVVAYPDIEGGAWKIEAEGFDKAVVKAVVSNVIGQKWSRAGDLGTVDNPGVNFGPRPGEQPLQTVEGNTGKDGQLYFSLIGTGLTVGNSEETANRYNAAEAYRSRLAGSVSFTTPDPYINPIGAALVMAADGAWGGKVWMHGAVGWRMALPGWRGAFAGDFLGMPERQRTHFDAYAKSQVTGVPVTKPHLMDSANNLARGAYVWGTPMYSNGYICRNPENNHQFHHYDMNLNYIDELLWHFQFDADTAYMRRMWPVLVRHLAWEKNTWDPDDDGLYDAYCCIWASDALQYNSGAVTHSSAYNYRGNLLASRIAEILADASPNNKEERIKYKESAEKYRKEAEKTLAAMNSRLWINSQSSTFNPQPLAHNSQLSTLNPQPSLGHWAEFQDFMGLKRVHEDAALWSIYTPIDCGACSPEQAYEATRYVDEHIPHFLFNSFVTLSTSDWSPYEWSINNVAMAEVMHTALAYWEAGRNDAAYQLLKGTVMDFMYCGGSPANFGQISHFDVNIGEAYRDFTDATGIASRAFIQGLYGITPDALNGRCIIRPGFPSSWDSASVRTPYLDYSFKRVNGKELYAITQRFNRPLTIVIRQNTGHGNYKDTVLTSDSVQTITLDAIDNKSEDAVYVSALSKQEPIAVGTALDDVDAGKCLPVDITRHFNANVTDIFKNKYLSPRSPYTTLALPVQGIGDWCSTKKTANIDDSGIRAMAKDGKITVADIPFSTPSEGHNIIFTSLWDNYPDSITVPLRGKGSHIYLLMAGSTNPMQSHFENGVVRVTYKDGTSEVLSLENPSNWCPIEQDYDDGSPAFTQPKPRPWRISLKTGVASHDLAKAMNVKRVGKVFDDPKTKVAALAIDGGAAEVLCVNVNPEKKLHSLTLTTTANDVVIGLMGITIQTNK